MANSWFRLYSEFAFDAKVQLMTIAMQRHLVMLMCLRCNGQETFQERELAFHLRVSLEELRETKAVFVESGFINEDWKLLNWARRQYISDTSTERVRRFRSGRKQVETFPKQVETVSVAPPDTDTDTEKKETIVRFTSNDCKRLYDAYPRREGWGAAEKKILLSLKNIDDPTPVESLLKIVRHYAKCKEGTERQFIPLPATWFHQKRYLDNQKEWEKR